MAYYRADIIQYNNIYHRKSLMEVNMSQDVNMFIKPIFDKKHKYHLSSYLELRSVLRNIKKTSPSFDMMMEMYEFIKLIEEIYMYGNNEGHYLFSAIVPKGYDAAMIYKENNFDIKYVLRRSDKHISIKITRASRNNKADEFISFNEGDNVIKNIIDEQKFLFIVACLMNGLSELIVYYYKNKKL